MYNNAKEAGLAVFGNEYYILSACKGKGAHYAYGFKWFFEGEEVNNGKIKKNVLFSKI